MRCSMILKSITKINGSFSLGENGCGGRIEIQHIFHIHFGSAAAGYNLDQLQTRPVPARDQFSNGKLLTFRDVGDFCYRICAHLSSESKQKSPDPLEYSKTDKSHGT